MNVHEWFCCHWKQCPTSYAHAVIQDRLFHTKSLLIYAAYAHSMFQSNTESDGYLDLYHRGTMGIVVSRWSVWWVVCRQWRRKRLYCTCCLLRIVQEHVERFPLFVSNWELLCKALCKVASSHIRWVFSHLLVFAESKSEGDWYFWFFLYLNFP